RRHARLLPLLAVPLSMLFLSPDPCLHSFPTRRSSDLRPGPAGIINEIRASLAINQEHELQWIVLWIGCRCSECHCCASYLGAGLDRKRTRLHGRHVWHRFDGFLIRMRAVTLWIVVVIS